MPTSEQGIFTKELRAFMPMMDCLPLTQDLANEVEKLFDFFKQNFLRHDYKHLVVSPFTMRQTWEENIENEIALAKQGKPAWMTLKMNSLIDPKNDEKGVQSSSGRSKK